MKTYTLVFITADFLPMIAQVSSSSIEEAHFGAIIELQKRMVENGHRKLGLICAACFEGFQDDLYWPNLEKITDYGKKNLSDILIPVSAKTPEPSNNNEQVPNLSLIKPEDIN